ncbi:MAG: type II toxin-antitoxin system VapC family toxin [Deltaproteobacteria bacterium]|nr:type II toxin-antitoxin system VapC family toxin [Deltaproteobacteria bacterium]
MTRSSSRCPPTSSLPGSARSEAARRPCAPWWLAEDPKLPEAARRALTDPANDVYVSAASAWEIATKFRLGRLPEFAELAAGVHAAWAKSKERLRAAPSWSEGRVTCSEPSRRIYRSEGEIEIGRRPFHAT